VKVTKTHLLLGACLAGAVAAAFTTAIHSSSPEWKVAAAGHANSSPVQVLDRISALALESGFQMQIEPEVVKKLEGTTMPNAALPPKTKAEKALNLLLKQYHLNLFSLCAHSSVASLRADPELMERREALVPMNDVFMTNSAPVPLVVIDDVPLRDAIKNLARYCSLELLIDYRAADKLESDAKAIRLREENVAVEEVLKKLLKKEGLTMWRSKATGVTWLTLH
jgi:hypothetical protein